MGGPRSEVRGSGPRVGLWQRVSGVARVNGAKRVRGLKDVRERRQVANLICLD